MRIILFLFIFFLVSCSNTKKVFICGEHECINKSEAKIYFEENLSIEVRVIDKNEEKSFNLVRINKIGEEDKDNKNIQVVKRQQKSKIRKLSKKEIIDKKNQIKLKKKEKKQANVREGKTIIKKEKLEKDKSKKKKLKIKNIKNENKELILTKHKNVCEIIEKCDIDEISRLLLKEGNTKKFPNISKR
tara:strand:+ start:1258 stop:1821 length:564 start_codon:yes stop_codon:yes gene_type:complete